MASTFLALAVLCSCVSLAFAQAPFITEAIVVLLPTENSTVTGIVRFRQTAQGVRIVARVQGLEPNSVHGFHVHEAGDISDPKGLNTGSHFNPGDQPHACSPDAQRHAGDLGNIQSDASGVAMLDIVDDHLPLNQPGVKGQVALGRGLIVHSSPDDCKTQPTGNAGARLAQGVVGVCTVACNTTYPIENAANWTFKFAFPRV